MTSAEARASGDATGAFPAVHDRNRASLIAFGAHLLGDRAAAEDIVQEAFVALAPQLENVGDPDRWLRTVVHRRCLNEIRRRKRQAAAHDRHANEPVTTYPVSLVADVDHELAAAVGRLSPRQRAAVLLCWGEGRSTDEAAAMLGCRPATLRVHLHRARRALQRSLAGVEPTAVAGIHREGDGRRGGIER